MGENTSQIEREIRAERTELGRNLRELESKARDIADWRTHHRNHPGLFLGLAFSGGVLLGLLATPSRKPSTAYADDVDHDLFDAPAPRKVDDTLRPVPEELLDLAELHRHARIFSVGGEWRATLDDLPRAEVCSR